MGNSNYDDLVLAEMISLGIGIGATAMPQIDPDARRRRLSRDIVDAAALARRHAVSVRHRGRSSGRRDQRVDAAETERGSRTCKLLGPTTHRPEYTGALAHAPRTETIALEPLDDSQMTTLSTELLGSRPVGDRPRRRRRNACRR